MPMPLYVQLVRRRQAAVAAVQSAPGPDPDRAVVSSPDPDPDRAVVSEDSP